MIIGKIQNAADYRGIHPMLDKALDCLNEEFLSSVSAETTYVDGKNLYATLNVFETLPEEQLFFEAHKNYLDIHVALSEAERIDVAYTPSLTPNEAGSKPENDFYAYTEKSAEHQTLILKPGTFLVAFPDDAHRCKGQVNGVSQVEKVVFKILIE